jgi:ParB-like chromosome segregation protein Spo0J
MMQLVEVDPDRLIISEELRRSGSAKQFEDRLRSSIDQIGLAEPIKVAKMPSGQYLVIDGTMRLRAITAIREKDKSRFKRVPAYVTDYERRYEIRYQTDIYQDLLPSQLATLVEHLHEAENVKKVDIARYIGVSPATLRNYTGLSRLIERGGLWEQLVELMDVGVFPSSNPFAWLRLDENAGGLRLVLEGLAEEGETAEAWVERMLHEARQGHGQRFQTVAVETLTSGLDDKYYRGDTELRQVKQDLGTRRALRTGSKPKRSTATAVKHLTAVKRDTEDPVLRMVAGAFKSYLK